jgi:hypothetical protein
MSQCDILCKPNPNLYLHVFRGSFLITIAFIRNLFCFRHTLAIRTHLRRGDLHPFTVISGVSSATGTAIPACVSVSTIGPIPLYA